MVILGGDLNMHPQDLGCRLLRTSTGLRDSYLETSKFDVGSWTKTSVIPNFGIHTCLSCLGLASCFLLQGCENGVTVIPENPFICKKELGPFDKGIRIDYILFKVGRLLLFHIS